MFIFFTSPVEVATKRLSDEVPPFGMPENLTPPETLNPPVTSNVLSGALFNTPILPAAVVPEPVNPVPKIKLPIES